MYGVIPIFRILFIPLLLVTHTCLLAQDESVRGYVTIEPFETRVEAICLPAAFAQEWNLPSELSGPTKESVLAKVLESLKSKTEGESPDQAFNFDTTYSRFVVLDPDLGYQADERDSIPLDEAIVGVSMSSLSKQVNKLSITWNWFAPGENRVPVQISAGDDLAARFLTLEQPSMVWQRDPNSAEPLPTLRKIPLVTMSKQGHRPILLKIGIGILALTGLIVLIMKTKTPSMVFFLIPLGFVALLGAFRFSKEVSTLPQGSEVNDLVDGLLRNTYHAFDFRDEEDIYEILSESIDDHLLEDIYLEVRKGLELEYKGGPRVRIEGLNLRGCEIIKRNDEGGSFLVQSEWDAVGNVNHWGHTHIRDNRYKAILQIKATKDRIWKIAKIQIQDEKRNSITQKNKTGG